MPRKQSRKMREMRYPDMSGEMRHATRGITDLTMMAGTSIIGVGTLGSIAGLLKK